MITLKQTIFSEKVPPIQVASYDLAELNASVLDAFLATAVAGVVGIAASFGTKGMLVTLAMSTASQVLHIRLLSNSQLRSSSKRQKGVRAKSRTAEILGLLGDKVLCGPCYKLGFHLDRIATGLYYDHDLHLTRGVDIQSLLPKQKARHSVEALLDALSGGSIVSRGNVFRTFFHACSKDGEVERISLQAWVSWKVHTLPLLSGGFTKVATIHTDNIDPKHLAFLCQLTRDANRIVALKPTKVKNDVCAKFSQKTGDATVTLTQTRFKTRIRQSSSQTIVVKIENKGSRLPPLTGRASRVLGKSASVALEKEVPATARIRSAYTLGREEPTTAESQRTNIIVNALQGGNTVLSQPLSRTLFFGDSSRVAMSNMAKSSLARPMIHFPDRLLNPSQVSAVNRVVSTDEADNICLIHGPPGTGKTTVIAACVKSIIADSADRTVWLIAQSNVAVKNIAEKLADVNFFDFKVLVSFEFHFDWHEHLYEQISGNIIRTDEFGDSSVQTTRALLGSRVILCTVSMLSNPRLTAAGFTRIVPLQTVIVDEASQIEVGDYLPLLHMFGKGVRKLAFIGDNKQLAPYGQDNIGDLRSVFELPHLRKRAVFLDTQYRMPVPIGDFISKHVYNGRLKTVHTFNARSCCRFVDVRSGKETKSGTSWENVEEADAVAKIARKYHADGKSYRIITLYDAQRNRIENMLKADHLPWENKCFNVDAFQGNEDDHIIISVVRSEKVGFVSNLRRANVMLSRCKKSMIICTSRMFVEGKASSTLVGQLGKKANGFVWLSWKDITAGKF